ncbi:hypothetical protein Dd586_3416 [Dickeya parazeae Ech586]|uniref:Uncharacterized protein n=1 Tax=Dickeya zeae (strain Ech586) TaxID=590409 RepID=D2BVW4_DICZ5|nr:hypothetical protein Dd586_3416 [Dickeya parazeae Ech586]
MGICLPFFCYSTDVGYEDQLNEKLVVRCLSEALVLITLWLAPVW